VRATGSPEHWRASRAAILEREKTNNRPLFLADWKRQEDHHLLEELGLPYTIKPINIGRGDQLTPDFLKISPNGRMPAIVDHEPMGGGAPISIFSNPGRS
jgi:hypothetical protein